MKEQISKYVCGDARVFFVSLSDAAARSAEQNELNAGETATLGKLEAFACGLAAMQKDAQASVSVKLSFADGSGFSATAERSGAVCGKKEDSSPAPEDALEVTLRLPLRGNYTGIVTGKGLDQLTADYFAQSLQIAAQCRVLQKETDFICIIADQLPGGKTDLKNTVAAAESLVGGEIPAGFSLLESISLRFGCTCSRSALLRVISALPETERRSLADNGKIVTFCNACGKKYTFEL